MIDQPFGDQPRGPEGAIPGVTTAPAPPAPTVGRRRPALLLVGLLLVAIAVGGGVGAAYISLRGPSAAGTAGAVKGSGGVSTPLPAASAASGSPGPSAVAAAGGSPGTSPGPGASSKPGASPKASAKPSAADRAAAKAYAAFQKRLLVPSTSYRAHAVERLSGSGGSLREETTLDVSGADYRFRIVISGTGLATTRLDFVVRHRAVWVRLNGSGWRRGTYTDDLAMPGFLGVLSSRDLAPAGAVKKSGATLYRLRSTEWYQPNSALARAAGMTITAGRLVLLIDRTGRPVSGSYHSTAEYRSYNYTGTGSYTFSDVGKKIVIAKP
jgi:hypothetical protein